MRRFTVMGFTEAELGFVVAAVFAAIAAMALDERDLHVSEGRERAVVEKELKQTLDELAKVRAELDQTKSELAKTRAADARRSTKIPQCWEKGQQSTPIADLVVVDANTYRMGGDNISLEVLRERLGDFIARGKELGCRFVVTARPQAGVDAVDQSTAVWRLRTYFDVNDRAR